MVNLIIGVVLGIIIVSIFMAYNKLDERLTEIEKRSEFNNKYNDDLEYRMKRSIEQIKNRLSVLEDLCEDRVDEKLQNGRRKCCDDSEFERE